MKKKKMKRSISITSALLLQLLLHTTFSTTETTEVSSAVVDDELQDLSDKVNEEDIIILHHHQEQANTEKRQERDNNNQDKNLISRYTQHYHRNTNIIPWRKYLHRILVQHVPYLHRKQRRRRRRKTTEKDEDETATYFKSSLFERNIDLVKGMGGLQYYSGNNNAKWVRAWCPPPSSSLMEDDKSIEVVGTENDAAAAACKSEKQQDEIDDDDSSNNIQEDDVQPGMVLFVQSSSDSMSSSSRSDSGDENALSTTLGGSACLTVLGEQYDNNEEIVQYMLLEQELHLGNIDVHKRDFAYHPVVARLENSRLTTQQLDEENAIVEASFGTRRYSQSKRDEEDHQVSFRWWSWVAHLSEMLHGGHNIFHNTADGKKGDKYQSRIYEEVGKSAFAGGSHGEVWKARRRCPSAATVDDENEGNSTTTQQSSSFSSSCDDGKDLIAKRLKIELGYSILEAGLREVYFGELLAREVESSTLFTTYVDHFFREGRRGQVELWIVFENAGPSLRSYMYEATVADGFVVFQNSAFWRKLRMGISRSRSRKTMDDDNSQNNKEDTDGNGGHLLKEVLRQIVSQDSSIFFAPSSSSNITHFLSAATAQVSGISSRKRNHTS